MDVSIDGSLIESDFSKHVFFCPQSTALQADPKYRKYSQLVDRTLQSFDNVNEWADFITFLAKLLKVCILVSQIELP